MNQLSFLGKIFFYTKAAKFYKNGDALSFVWCWWNPLSWVFAVIFFLLSVLLDGISDTWRYRHELGFCVDPFFVKSGKKIEWL